MSRRAAKPAFIPTPPAFNTGLPLILRDQAYEYMAKGLMGELDKPDPADAETERLRQLCRDGNPFPLIAHQWPDLQPATPQEAEFFATAPLERLERVPASLRDVAFKPGNPSLRLDWWQKIILAGFFDPTIGEIAIKGCTGAGKGAAVGIGFSLWFDVFDESRITLSGRDYSHAVVNIFGEVKQWFLRMKHPAAGQPLKQSIADSERHYIRILNPDPSSATAGEAFSGAHGKNTAYCFDEATSHPDSFIENAEKNARKIVTLANPRTLYGRFRDSFKPLGPPPALNMIGVVPGILGNRLCVTVSGLDCLNVRQRRLKKPVAPLGGIEIAGHVYQVGERISDEHFKLVQPLIPNQIDLQQYNAICSKPDKRQVAVFAHGEFPTEDPEKQLILASWLELHEKAWLEELPAVEAFGLDVARSLDGDATVFAAGGSKGVRAIHRWQYNDITYHESNCLRIAREEYGIDLTAGRVPVVVDMDGLGAGLGDNLRRRGVWVIEFRGNATAQFDPRTYKNLRTEVYALLGRRLNPDDAWRGQPWALPSDDNLRQELTAPEKNYDADGLRFGITSKSKSPDHPEVVCIKDKIGRSPDSADGVVYLFHAVRVLHNWDDWLRASQRQLVVFPAVGESTAMPPKPQNGEAAKEDPTVAWLREQYGDLVAKDSRPPEEMQEKLQRWKRENMPEPAAGPENGNGNGNGHAHQPEPAADENGKSDSWLARVRWED